MRSQAVYRTARKEWVCDGCGKPIEAGTQYCFESHRLPTGDEHGQTGIVYWQQRYHSTKCYLPVLPEECRIGNHKWEQMWIKGGEGDYPTQIEDKQCTECGAYHPENKGLPF